jgi:hypothetical protein
VPDVDVLTTAEVVEVEAMAVQVVLSKRVKLPGAIASVVTKVL